MRNSRTLSRLIWLHVPLKLMPDGTTPKKGDVVDPDEAARQIMGEKRMALDLIEA
jgi:putative membrane protein